MNLLSLLHFVGALISITPTATPRKTSFEKVEILYKTSVRQPYVQFQLEAYIGNKWVLIDHDVTCKELQSSSIIEVVG